jgi:hypothetical protein
MAAKPNQVFKDVTLDVAEKALVISYSTDPGGGGEVTHHKKRCVARLGLLHLPLGAATSPPTPLPHPLPLIPAAAFA